LLLPDITAAALSRQYNSLPQNKKNIKMKMAGKSNYKIQRELRSLRSQPGEMGRWGMKFLPGIFFAFCVPAFPLRRDTKNNFIVPGVDKPGLM